MPDRKQLIERLRAMARREEGEGGLLDNEPATAFKEAADSLEHDAAVLETAQSEDVVQGAAKAAWDAIEALDGSNGRPAVPPVDIEVLEYAMRSALPAALQHAQEQVGENDAAH
jgi:hypothetical protein